MCPFCSNIALNTHDQNTCYMTGTDSSYGLYDSSLCHWKCLRCTGPTENDCIACLPGINLVLQQDPLLTFPMCMCDAGYFEDSVLKSCVKCHPNCDVCSDSSKKCAACATGIFRYLGQYCETFCPFPYVENTASLICEYAAKDPSYNLGCPET